MIDFTNNDIVHIKNGNVEYLEFRILNQYSDKLKHCFTLRHGGVSRGLYDSLNFRTTGNDKKENVYKNIEIICNKLNISPDNICKAHQLHTDDILVLNNNNKQKYNFRVNNDEKFDAYVTNEKNIATLVTTADCNPIIIYDPVKNVVANVHSGWKGTVKQIYLKVAKFLHKKFECNYLDLIVCVGPSINKCCWLSQDEDLRKLFLSIWPYEDEYIENKENGYFGVDFPYVIKKDLINLGLKKENIVLSNICTCCNTESFYSYRDATKKAQKDYGTMATIVELI